MKHVGTIVLIGFSREPIAREEESARLLTHSHSLVHSWARSNEEEERSKTNAEKGNSNSVDSANKE